MSFFKYKEGRFFQKVATGLFVAYAFLMVLVTILAFLRPSGATGIDPAQMMQMRKNISLSEKEIQKP